MTNSNISVIDNFLPDNIFDEIKTMFFHQNFPWFFNETSVFDNDKCPQFVHLFYQDMEPYSQYWDKIKPVIFGGLQLRNCDSLIKVKANATPVHSSVVRKRYHYDFLEDIDDAPKLAEDENYPAKPGPHNVAILYLNSNDGFTFFKDGPKIESIENRCIMFPGYLQHAGSTCTNAPLRVVLNISFNVTPNYDHSKIS